MPLPAFNTLNKRQQLAITVGVPALLAALFLYLSHKSLTMLGPDPELPGFLQREGGRWGDINAKLAEIAVQEAIIAEKPKIVAQLAALEQEIKEAEERLPLDAEKGEMRQLIEKLARDISSDIGVVRLKSVRIVENPRSAERKGGDYQVIVYQTDLTGDLNGIIKYIDSIEKNQRFMTVRSLAIRPGTLTLDEAAQKIVPGLHAVSMDLVTYVYNSAAGAKKRGGK